MITITAELRQRKQAKLVSYTDSSSEEDEEDLHVDAGFEESIVLAIN